jgi:hypothetical protein
LRTAEGTARQLRVQLPSIVKILRFNLDIAPMQVCFINRKTVEGNQSMRLFRECFSAVVAGERA